MKMHFWLVDQDERPGSPAVQEFAHEEDDLFFAAAQIGQVVDVAAFGLDDQFPVRTSGSLSAFEEAIKRKLIGLKMVA